MSMENVQPDSPSGLTEVQQIRQSLYEPKRPSPFWIAVGAVAVVILVIGAVVQVLTPDTVTVPQTTFISTNPNNTITNLKSVTYTGPAVETPNEFSIFSAQRTLTKEAVIADLLAKYGLIKPSPDSNAWVNGNISLIEDKTVGTLNLRLTLGNPAEQLPIINATEAIQVASTFLAQTFPEVSLRPMMETTSYYVYGLEPDSNVPPEEANIMNISYTPVLESENYPVVFEKALYPAFTVAVDGKNTIRSVTFFPVFSQYVKIDSKVPISVDEALAQIQTGVASIIDATIASNERVLLSQLTSAEFTSAEIEYREDPTTQLLYPFYHFRGTAKSDNNITATVSVITPAVKTTPTAR